MKQSGQNVELTNFTEAMYAAREAAMERMQASALALAANAPAQWDVFATEEWRAFHGGGS